jgi:membrane associated rhomboid family serine protease
MNTKENPFLPVLFSETAKNQLPIISFFRVKKNLCYLISAFKSLPPVIRTVTSICLVLFLVQLISFEGFGFNFNELTEIYFIKNEKFNLFQIFTFSFTHKDIFHIIWNLVFFILIGTICEKIIGTRLLISLIFTTISINIIGVQITSPEGGSMGLSVILSAILVVLFLVRNNLETTLNFSIKFLCLIMIFNDSLFLLLGFLDNKSGSEISTYYLHFLGFVSGFVFVFGYNLLFKFKNSRFYPKRLIGKLELSARKLKSIIILIIKRTIDKIRDFLNIKNLNGKVGSIFYTPKTKTIKIQILILSAGILMSNVSHSQTKFKFSNSSIKLYESSLNKGIDELLKDENTSFSKESESIGLYEIDLLKKTLNLSYNGSEETFLIKDYKKENDLLYINTITQDKNKDNIAYYRINLNKDVTENAFIHQYYYSNIQITYGIVSDKIEFLACE